MKLDCIWYIYTFKLNKIPCSSFPSTFQWFFNPCRILQISSTLKLHKYLKCFQIWNYLPHFSLWKISLQLGKILCFSFPLTFQSIFHPCRILKISSTFKLHIFQKCIRIRNKLSHFCLWKISVILPLLYDIEHLFHF